LRRQFFCTAIFSWLVLWAPPTAPATNHRPAGGTLDDLAVLNLLRKILTFRQVALVSLHIHTRGIDDDFIADTGTQQNDTQKTRGPNNYRPKHMHSSVKPLPRPLLKLISSFLASYGAKEK
jgi:hypothetical protein